MNTLLQLCLLGLLGLSLHIVVKLYEDYKAMLATPEEDDDNNFWKVWKKRNFVTSLLSIFIVVGLIIGQYYMWDIITTENAFFIGYMLDSTLKNFAPKKP